MAVQGSDAALNLFDYVTIPAGGSVVVGLLHVYGMTRLTYHVVQAPGSLPATCTPLVGYRRNPTQPGDIAFIQVPPGLLPIAAPVVTAAGLAVITVNTICTEVMGIQITNNDLANTALCTVILSASA